MELPKRKANRLQYYDYKSPGYYFVTICTANKKQLFWKFNQLIDGVQVLSEAGTVVENSIHRISQRYPYVHVVQYNVMPNHVHLLIQLEEGNTVTLSRIVGQTKWAISRTLGDDIWQKSYHDHVIRGEKDYLKIWEYVAYNHQKWKEDCFYEE